MNTCLDATSVAKSTNPDTIAHYVKCLFTTATPTEKTLRVVLANPYTPTESLQLILNNCSRIFDSVLLHHPNITSNAVFEIIKRHPEPAFLSYVLTYTQIEFSTEQLTELLQTRPHPTHIILSTPNYPWEVDHLLFAIRSAKESGALRSSLIHRVRTHEKLADYPEEWLDELF